MIFFFLSMKSLKKKKKDNWSIDYFMWTISGEKKEKYAGSVLKTK